MVYSMRLLLTNTDLYAPNYGEGEKKIASELLDKFDQLSPNFIVRLINICCEPEIQLLFSPLFSETAIGMKKLLGPNLDITTVLYPYLMRLRDCVEGTSTLLSGTL